MLATQPGCCWPRVQPLGRQKATLGLTIGLCQVTLCPWAGFGIYFWFGHCFIGGCKPRNQFPRVCIFGTLQRHRQHHSRGFFWLLLCNGRFGYGFGRSCGKLTLPKWKRSKFSFWAPELSQNGVTHPPTCLVFFFPNAPGAPENATGEHTHDRARDWPLGRPGHR